MISRYCNIWRKRKVRRLLGVFVSVAVMIGAMTGCGRVDGADSPSTVSGEVQGEVPETGNMQGGNPSGEPSAEAGREASTVLTVITEGLEAEVKAELYTGEGYSFYVTDDHWVNYVPNSWYVEQNEQVRFWISSYAGLNQKQVERILTAQGYQTTDRQLWKVEGDTLYTVRCLETETDVWAMHSAYPPEFEEGWCNTLWAMFDTFEVAEGYDVSAVMPRAVMPEGEHLQLYETTYADATSRAWDLQEPEYTGSYIYDELTISNVTDTTFDFTVKRRNYETEESETVLSGGTAHINEDGISAVFEGEDYTLSFDFSDAANPLPVVFTITLWGVEDLEGISFSNNNVPGYDAG